MDLDLARAEQARVIVPYVFKDRTYYLLFHRSRVVGPFYVSDSPYVVSHSLLTIGEIKHKDTDQVMGNIFYTTRSVKCSGTFLLAYSGMFKDSLSQMIPKDFDMSLVLKTEFMQVFNKKNRATLVISPSLKTNIRQNLEV